MNPMLANIVFQFFSKGGPVMWPILASAVVAVAVVGERAFWWLREGRNRDAQKLEQVLAALENGDVAAARTIAEGSEDPVIRMIRHGLGHVHSSLEGALQLAAGVELKRAGRFLTVMDTLVTLAPLLGLLGTVTGLMRAFFEHWQRGTFGLGRHRRHWRSVDCDGVRPGHRHLRARPVQLFLGPGDPAAV
jgi:biopolymer transport protein ExbB